VDIFASLGIDWQMLILQILAFIILVFILAKFIYPQIAAMLDRHDQKIADSLQAASEAEAKAEKMGVDIDKKLTEARAEAQNIVATAQKESTNIVESAEAEAVKKADSLMTSARIELDREVQSARQALRAETVELVAIATEKVVAEKITKTDRELIARAVKGAE
jgi:F-type H+-transporting ATPase subunit b